MKRSILHRIVALSMTALMFLSSVGFTLDVHFCKDELKSISLFGKAKSCQEMGLHSESDSECHKSKTCSNTHRQNQLKGESVDKPCDEACCNNNTIVFHSIDNDYTLAQSAGFELTNAPFIVPSVINYLVYDIDFVSCSMFDNYKPPITDKDMQVLFQSFLI